LGTTIEVRTSRARREKKLGALDETGGGETGFINGEEKEGKPPVRRRRLIGDGNSLLASRKSQDFCQSGGRHWGGGENDKRFTRKATASVREKSTERETQ